ncbi:PREDICTED: neuromedin-U receptor 1 [Miniopterus natalensis]|uniref:neuromedin-U receptor 1 n=1 Tax=Miniopterus natalensis TaxID=291302 RepID=UPI0007A6CD65|nr:PREDICTED: neuromedin-U receptor 1 [Miniopterus natalensis]
MPQTRSRTPAAAVPKARSPPAASASSANLLETRVLGPHRSPQLGSPGGAGTAARSSGAPGVPFCLNCSIFPEDVSSQSESSPVPCNSSRALGLFHPEDLNLTDQELKLKYLGPQQTELFAPICVIYLLIFLVGTVGNGLTCLVILRHKAMRTPTNYYLFSLAVSDLLVLLLGLPLELYEMWQNYPYLLGAGGCYFRTLLFETVCLASVLNVTALSVERYVAVVHPLQARLVMTQAHVRRMLGAVWGLALLCSLPNTSLHGIQQLHVPCRGTVPGSAVCMLVGSRALYHLLMQITTLLFFCLPMAAISVLYLLVGLRLRREGLLLRQGAKGKARASDSRRLQRLEDRSRTQVTKMLFVLVLVFGICWAPFHIDRLMWSSVSRWTEGLLLAFQYVHVVSGVFFYLSSAANPVLYSLMSSRFRDTFREALCLGTRCRRHRLRSSSRSLSRVTTGSTVCDLGSLGSKTHPLAENCGPEGLQEADPSLCRGASKQFHLGEPEGHMQLWEPRLISSSGMSSCLSPFVPHPHAATSVTPDPTMY